MNLMRKMGSVLAFLLITLGVGMATTVRAQGEAAPNTLRMKTDLLVVTAHPDDEGMMAASMARYSDEGKVVSLVTCTHGEGGGNGTGKEYAVSLGIVREAELRRCLSILGTRHLYFLHQPDWAYTESVKATLERWGHEESLRRLVRLVRILRPEVMATMDPAPVGGQHGHHQAAGRLATEAFEAAADPQKFPELIQDEGLAPWRVRKLYWVSWGGMGTVQIATDGVAKGVLASASPGKNYSEIGMDGESNHRSQGFDKFIEMMARSGQKMPARPNGFLLVKSRISIDPKAERDLFDGIAGANVDGPSAAHDVLAASLPSTATNATVEVRIRPRENVVNYREWLQANGISRLMTRLPAHVTVIQAMPAPVVVEVINHTSTIQSGKVALQVPSGFQLAKPELSYTLPANSTRAVTFEVKAPVTTPVSSVDVTARLSDSASDAGQLDVVPALVVSRLAKSLPVDADIAKWEQAGIKPTSILPADLIQGEVKGPEECSGRFFVGHDAEGLQVLVEVTDDTVVSNIAPDDIKAHWRSTSVEICLDPNPRNENTFQTFKLGIFPQDTTGKVKAARDADANPGLINPSSSGVQLASKRTPNGYIVEARIPWAEVAKNLKSRPNLRTLGFNIILYHAGKKQARVGEDIGKSRLGWSFWNGVPGRPEVWGTLSLR